MPARFPGGGVEVRIKEKRGIHRASIIAKQARQGLGLNDLGGWNKLPLWIVYA